MLGNSPFYPSPYEVLKEKGRGEVSREQPILRKRSMATVLREYADLPCINR